MRILLVSPRYIPYIGGVEYVVKSIAERLSKMGHGVTVLAGDPFVKQIKEELINKVRVIRWPTQVFREAYHIPRMRNKLKSLIRELVRKVDVIHIHSAHAVLPVYVGIKAKKIYPNIKLVFSPHYHACGHTLIRELFWRVLWRRYVKKLIGYADKIHAVSNVEAERIINHYHEARDKLIIIPNGIEEDVLQHKWKDYNSDYVIYAGRIEKYKRLELAIELSRDLGLKLLIIGNGIYKKKLRKYSRLRYPNGVIFKDFVPRDKYLKLLLNAKYAINLSEYEAFSIFIAEALAIGLPAIVSETIARIYNNMDEFCLLETKIFKVIDGKTFILLKSRDHAMKIIKTWNDIVAEYITKLYNK